MAGGRAPWEHFKIVSEPRHLKYKSARCRYCDQLLTQIQPSRHLKKHIMTCERMPVEIREAYAMSITETGQMTMINTHLSNGGATLTGALDMKLGCEVRL
ncbi:hypothetical protein PR002_g2185 [Phytophthora rubi]|uniref:Uncharacterized protein n=1 Tax=Phytophthora rubi TaxID=129364 RepID=A0A6A3NYK3_9STRA|nr:hypothetical protein PR002_g2185 [Phytophthora rubi]